MSAQPDWQPMETAPRDGKPIWLLVATWTRKEASQSPVETIQVIGTASKQIERGWEVPSDQIPDTVKLHQVINWAPLEATA